MPIPSLFSDTLSVAVVEFHTRKHVAELQEPEITGTFTSIVPLSIFRTMLEKCQDLFKYFTFMGV
jgi:hypothetical protein